MPKMKSQRLSGSGDWSVPVNCSFLMVTLVGAGGGGGAGTQITTESTYPDGSGGGGGGGECWHDVPYPLSGETTIAYSVGVGGAGGQPTEDGIPGEDGEVGGTTVFGKMNANGGGAGTAPTFIGEEAGYGYGGAGGGALGGALQNLGGTAGNNPDPCDSTWRVGGSGGGSGVRGALEIGGSGGDCVYAGGTSGVGVAVPQSHGGGGGGSSPLGNGGAGADIGEAPAGSPTVGYGGGGGGGFGQGVEQGPCGAGGDGEDGTIVITWIE